MSQDMEIAVTPASDEEEDDLLINMATDLTQGVPDAPVFSASETDNNDSEVNVSVSDTADKTSSKKKKVLKPRRGRSGSSQASASSEFIHNHGGGQSSATTGTPRPMSARKQIASPKEKSDSTDPTRSPRPESNRSGAAPSYLSAPRLTNRRGSASIVDDIAKLRRRGSADYDSDASSVLSGFGGSRLDRRGSTSLGVGVKGEGGSMRYTLEEVLEQIEVKEVHEFEPDWRLLVTPGSGSVWVNQRTGQFRQSPPNYIFKKQHLELQDRDKEREDYEKRIKDLEDLSKDAMENKRLKNILEEQYGELQLKHDELKEKHEKVGPVATDSSSKSKNAYTLRLEKELHFLKSQIASMEIRTAEADTMEKKLEILTEKMEAAESSNREKDFEVLQCRRKTDEATRKMEAAMKTVEELRSQNEDLKRQVREEIERNTRIEMGLGNLDKVRKESENALNEIRIVTRERDDKIYLLKEAKKKIREYRDQLREIEREQNEVQKIQDELTLTRYENAALERLLMGKDALIEQQAHDVEQSRDLVAKIREEDPELVDKHSQKGRQFKAMKKSQNESHEIHLLDRLQTNSSQNSDGKASVFANKQDTTKDRYRPTAANKELLDISSLPYSKACNPTHTNGSDHCHQMRPFSAKSPYASRKSPIGERKRPSTAVVRSHQRGDTPSMRSSSPGTVSSSLSRDHSGTRGSVKVHAGRTQAIERATGLPKHEVDRVLSLFVHIGDRVEVPIKNASEELHEGTVKYLGHLDKGTKSRKFFVGLKLDHSVGDCDGTFNSNRYFKVSPDKGKIMRISAIRTVYNVKSGRFISIEDHIQQYMKQHR